MTGPQRTAGPVTGPQRTPPPVTGPQRTPGSATGPQRASGPATGPQRTPGPVTGPLRTPGPGTSGSGTNLPRAPGLHRAPKSQQASGSGTGARRLGLGQPPWDHGTAPAVNGPPGDRTGAQPALGNGMWRSHRRPACPGQSHRRPACPGQSHRRPACPGHRTGAQPALGGPASAGPAAVHPCGASRRRVRSPRRRQGSAAGTSRGSRFPTKTTSSVLTAVTARTERVRTRTCRTRQAGSPGSTHRPPETFAVPVGRRRSAKAKPKRRLLSRPALLAAVAVVVLLAGFGGYKFLYEPRVNAPVSPSLRLPTSAPRSPDFDQSLGKWQHIGTRTEDPPR